MPEDTYIPLENTSLYKKPATGIRKACFRVGRWYDEQARKEIERMGDTSPREYMLIEGAGKVLIQRVKQYGVERVAEMLKEYIQSEKFIEYPRLTAALSADTITKIEMQKLRWNI